MTWREPAKCNLWNNFKAFLRREKIRSAGAKSFKVNEDMTPGEYIRKYLCQD